MLKKSIVAIIACIFVCSVEAAGKFDLPNYEYIQSIGKEKYESMVRSFFEQDSLLSLIDIQTIYYGSAFYGYLGKGMKRDVYQAAQQRGMAGFTAFLDSCLSVTPMDLQTIACRFTAAQMAKDTAAMYKYSRMYNRISTALMLTGDGRTDTTAVHVVSISDEYSLLTYVWHATLEEQTLTYSLCDKMDCITKNGQKKSIYFDVQLVCAMEQYNLSDRKEPFHFWYNSSINKQKRSL